MWLCCWVALPGQHEGLQQSSADWALDPEQVLCFYLETGNFLWEQECLQECSTVPSAIFAQFEWGSFRKKELQSVSPLSLSIIFTRVPSPSSTWRLKSAAVSFWQKPGGLIRWIQLAEAVLHKPAPLEQSRGTYRKRRMREGVQGKSRGWLSAPNPSGLSAIKFSISLKIIVTTTRGEG